MADGIYITDAWRPTNPLFTNGQDNRSPEKYRAVLAQFDVEHNPRYTPRNNNTFCNIFVWDASKAMGAEVPHWVLPDGSPGPMGKGHELNANAVVAWLEGEAVHYGWTPCTEAEAVANANAGCPTVVVWDNPGGTGHVAMVMPDTASESGTRIAQAGGSNHYDVNVAVGFGSSRLAVLKYFKHA